MRGKGKEREESMKMREKEEAKEEMMEERETEIEEGNSQGKSLIMLMWETKGKKKDMKGNRKKGGRCESESSKKR